MKRENVKCALINSAIDVIATQGLDKATTKLIANVAGLNEVYIYRNFNDKEDLFVKVFEYLDDNSFSLKSFLHILLKLNPLFYFS